MIFSKDVCILVLKDFVRGLSRLIVLMLLDDDACEETRFSCNLLVKLEAFYTGLNSLFLFMDCKGRTFTTVTGSWKVKPKSVIRLLCANKLSFCHLPFRFSVAMEPHCALKT